jgi:acyl-CoA thioester hydrolase
MEHGGRCPSCLKMAYHAQRRIEFRDTDAAGIAHFTAFFNYMEEVEHEFLRSVGLSVIKRDAGGVLSWPRVSVHCDYSGAVHFEDVLDIELSIDRIGEKSVTYHFLFHHLGRQVAAGRLTAVCCRMESDGPRSLPIPAEIVAKLKGS